MNLRVHRIAILLASGATLPLLADDRMSQRADVPPASAPVVVDSNSLSPGETATSASASTRAAGVAASVESDARPASSEFEESSRHGDREAPLLEEAERRAPSARVSGSFATGVDEMLVSERDASIADDAASGERTMARDGSTPQTPSEEDAKQKKSTTMRTKGEGASEAAAETAAVGDAEARAEAQKAVDDIERAEPLDLAAASDSETESKPSHHHHDEDEETGGSDAHAAEDPANAAAAAKAPDADDEEDESFLNDRVAVDYASKAAGALILEKSKSFKGTSNLLNADKDRYAISACDEKKFVVIGLSEDILVKTIKLANYERFSSRVKKFQVLGGQVLGQWSDLGTFGAKAGNGEQTFNLMEPTWARYLKFRFLRHHGTEHYCTVSQIKVHGSTMVQGFHEQWGEEEEEELTATEGDVDKAKAPSTLGASTEKIDDESQVGGESASTKPEGTADEKTVEEDAAEANPASDDDTIELDTSADKVETEASATVPKVDSASSVSSSSSLRTFRSRHRLHRSASSDLERLLRGEAPEGELVCDADEEREEIDDALSSLGEAALETIVAAAQIVSDTSEAIASPTVAEAVEEVIKRVKSTRVFGSDAPMPERIAATGTTDDDSNSDSSDSEDKQDAAGDDVGGGDGGAPTEPKDVATTRSPGANAQSAEYPPISPTRKESRPGVDPPNIDVTLDALIRRFPNAKCLSDLNYAEFKAKAAQSGSNQQSNSAKGMEPIFKKLTSELKALHASLAAHDQYAQISSECYQSVLLDVLAENERQRVTIDERLARLEEQFDQPAYTKWISMIVSTIVWILSLVVYSLLGSLHFIINVPEMIAKSLMTLWPYTKGFMLTFRAGRVLSNRLSPAVEFVDELQGRIGTYDLGHLVDGAHTVPVFPAMAVLFVLRFLMWLTSKPSLTLKKRYKLFWSTLRIKTSRKRKPSVNSPPPLQSTPSAELDASPTPETPLKDSPQPVTLDARLLSQTPSVSYSSGKAIKKRMETS